MRVFVADDDQKILTFIVNGLKQEGYMVDSARDGEEALPLMLSASTVTGPKMPRGPSRALRGTAAGRRSKGGH